MISLGECCVALQTVMGASQKFETFLSHRGEEMGSIRGRVRVHVPKDRRAIRKKIYGGSAEKLVFWNCALLALSLPSKTSSPLSLHSLTFLCASHCFLYLVPQWSHGLALHSCWYLSSTSSFGSWLTDADQMHPETLSIRPPGQAQHTHKQNFAEQMQTGSSLLHARNTDF